MVTERTTTDCLCLILFMSFILAMIAVSVFAVNQGDVSRILTPYDSDGNECGQPKQNASIGLIARDFTDFKYKYFASAMQTITGDNSRAYDAICVKKCPVGIPDLTSAEYLN
jgi:hypothetical protein